MRIVPNRANTPRTLFALEELVYLFCISLRAITMAVKCFNNIHPDSKSADFVSYS